MDSPTDDETEDQAPAKTSFRVRDVFAFRRRAEPERGEDAEPEVPPMPAEPPTVPAQPAHGGGRLPAWWEPKKDISAGPGVGGIKWINGVPHHVPAPKPKQCEHPEPHEVRNKVTGHLLAYWCAECETQLSVPDDYDELADITDEDGDGGEVDEDGNPVDKVPAAVRRRWTMRGNGKKTYARPVYGKTSEDGKKSGIEAWTALPKKTRHLLYNGVALGAGFYLGVPQFFTDEVAYLVANYSSWTDFYVCVWYGIAVGIWVLDYRTRNWFPPFALAARIPLVSMIVGVLLYGDPAA
ncbi:hypothetical protein [Streptomyces sp. ITFR-6]|uniref:hypothetical protein n=1 Tax=Streptomyces sp. ITFR-6 TaxID=3075197 RepID=UPI00288B622B|nr:hypothetical protein [Streptomyces sp. ITFR-6]WNI31489.1 hypothetical protein RLT59_23870 [Streptomyces sp. ITFR-6]